MYKGRLEQENEAELRFFEWGQARTCHITQGWVCTCQHAAKHGVLSCVQLAGQDMIHFSYPARSPSCGNPWNNPRLDVSFGREGRSRAGGEGRAGGPRRTLAAGPEILW